MSSRRDIFIAAVEAGWRDLTRILDAVPPDDMDVPGVCGEWSVRDLLGHIAMWDDIAIQGLRGNPPRRPESEEELNAINGAGVALKKDLSAVALRWELDEKHRELEAVLADAPDDRFDLNAQFWRDLEVDTVFHYADHGKQIRDWLARQ